jgi:hypothetical protein
MGRSIGISKIMNNWRQFLKEEKTLSMVDLGCYVPISRGSDEKEAFLYDASFILENLEEIINQILGSREVNLIKDDLFLSKIMKGVIFIEPTSSTGGGRCNSAWQVSGIAGPGYGPILYQIGFYLTPTEELTSDRGSVKIGARKNWRKQFDSDEREKNPFDDIEKPRTPPKEDDCIIHWQKKKIDPRTKKPIINPETGSPEMENVDQLNYSYETKTEDIAIAQKLIQNHEDTLNMIKYMIEENNILGLGKQAEKISNDIFRIMKNKFKTFFQLHSDPNSP